MLKALCLGWITSSLNVILSLRGAGIETVVVNTEPYRFFDRVPALYNNIPIALNLYQESKIPKPKVFRFLLIILPNTLSFGIKRQFASILQDNGIDFVFAHWGVGVLPEIALAKSIAPNIPVILNMETFPTSPSSWMRETLEVEVFKRMAKYLDGLIIPTREMADLIYDLAPATKQRPCWIKPMYYPVEYAPKNSLPRLSEMDGKPHVVFMGQFDTRHSINDVRGELLSLAQAGIVVHCAAMEGLYHHNIVSFEPFDGTALVSGALTTFMTQFDACLVTYHLPEASNRIRFRTSLPARFLISLAAGLPIILPRGVFRAMESFVEKERVGFAFGNIEELYLALTDPNWRELRERSRFKQTDFLFNAQEFLHFINLVLQERSG